MCSVFSDTLGDLSWAFGWHHMGGACHIPPTGDGGEGQLANQGPEDTGVLSPSWSPICCHQPSLGFSLAFSTSSWKSGPMTGILSSLS